MTAKNYCIVNTHTNLCENIIVWDGNVESWQPPAGYIALPQDSTPAKTWRFDLATNDMVLVVGSVGQIGSAWDGEFLTTTEELPVVSGYVSESGVQPVVTGAQTL